MRLTNNFQLIIHAPNIHSGGGRTLLISLLQNSVEMIDVQFLLNERMSSVVEKKYLSQVKFFKSTFLGRIKAEYWLRINSNGRPILAFGNLPPIFPNPSKIFLFIQNKYLVTNYSTKSFPFFTRIRILIEKIWLNFFKSNVDVFIVQTTSMKKIFADKNYYKNKKIIVLPIMDLNFNLLKHANTIEGGDFTFIYPASGEPHKNHKNLILSWVELSKEDIFPDLILTLDPKKNIKLLKWIELQKALHNLRIINQGSLEDSDVNLLIGNCSALVYPSLFESFGIPLLVARKIEVPIIASELDFVRDVSSPKETFDPNSPTSIARAVKRFMGINMLIENTINPKNFYEKIFGINSVID
jgi:glycosyltransferase involved in cell wall biosynthesis